MYLDIFVYQPDVLLRINKSADAADDDNDDDLDLGVAQAFFNP